MGTDAPTLEEILADFPNAALGRNCRETSPKSDKYNCIAWAARDDTREWDPKAHSSDFHPYAYWPRRAPAGRTIDAIKALFMFDGYAEIDNDRHESGVEKLAIFADNGRPTHVARQLPDGTWTSKLGRDEDISHSTPSVLEGGDYGRVVLVLARPFATGP